MEEFVVKNKKKLRYGITTGTCGAAAAEAAAELLILNVKKDIVNVITPKGTAVEVPVKLCSEGENKTEYMVIKDSGDDPDVTNNAEIHVSVEITDNIPEKAFKSEEYPNLYLDGGLGVGRVTKKGLEQSIGYAAINTVPRTMIFKAVGQVCSISEFNENLLITVSVPKGRELAEKTFNPRLGIEGGISILGTSGIIEPMSERAIIDTIETEIKQLTALGRKSIIVTPGNYGRGYVSDYLKLDLSESIKCSNYIGETLDMAVYYGIKNFLLVGNVGKLVKTAAGIMNTHSKVADGRGEIFALHSMLRGADRKTAIKIMECINTDEMLEILEREKLREAVTESILKKVKEYFRLRIGNSMKFGVMMFSEKFGFLGQTEGTEEVIENIRRM